MKTIVHINAVSKIRSTGRIVSDIEKKIVENDMKSIVVYSDGDGDNKFKMKNVLDKKIHAILSRITGLQGYFSKKETKKIIDIIDKEEPSLIHLHNLHANFINLPLLFKYIIENKLPVVITLHDCWFYTGNRTHYTVDKCYNWIDCDQKCIKSESMIPSWFFDRHKKLLKDRKYWINSIEKLGVVGVSNWITNESKKSILKDATIVKRIYNWVDVEIFYPREKNIILKEYFNKKIILGVSSNWNNSKGLNKFVELSHVISDNTLIVLVGNIDEKYILPSNIVNIRETHSLEELATIYSEADVFVNFSLEETFGNVTAESLACGTPVIVMNSTASPELVGYNCGYVSKDNSVVDVVEKINIILDNGKSYYHNYCRDHAIDNFNKDTLIKEYINLYQDLMEL